MTAIIPLLLFLAAIAVIWLAPFDFRGGDLTPRMLDVERLDHERTRRELGEARQLCQSRLETINRLQIELEERCVIHTRIMNKLYHEREGHTGALNVISKERQAHERTLGERDEALRICKNRLDVINSLQNELHELESRQEDSLLQADRFLNVYGVSNLVNLSGDDIRHRVNMDEFPPPVFMRGTGMELWSELDVRKWMEGLKMFQAAAEGGGKDD